MDDVEIVRDFLGQPIGRIIRRGDRSEVTDFHGKPLGTADSSGTRDFLGRPISSSNVPGLLFSPQHNPMLKDAEKNYGENWRQAADRIEKESQDWRRDREADARRASEEMDRARSRVDEFGNIRKLPGEP